MRRMLLASVWTTVMACAGLARAQGYWEQWAEGWLTNGQYFHSYRVYVDLPAYDRLTAAGIDLVTGCGCEIFQDELFGNDLPPNPAYFLIDPDLEYDTFVAGPCSWTGGCETFVLGTPTHTPLRYQVGWGEDGSNWPGGYCLVLQFTLVGCPDSGEPWFSGVLQYHTAGNPDIQTFEFASFPDCNGNCIPDEQDIANCPGDPWCSDCNNNGIPDECDIASGYSQDVNSNGIPDECEGGDDADLDGDGDVDLADLAILLAHYGMTEGATHADGDIDGDGDVDLADLAILLAHYGEGT